MKKKLLNSGLALLFLCLSSGVVFGQSAISAKKTESLDSRLKTQVEVKHAKRSMGSTQRADITLPTNATIPTSVKRKAAKATNVEATPYFEDFETPPAGIEYLDEILPGLGWTVISGGKDNDMIVLSKSFADIPGYNDSDYFLAAGYDDNSNRNEWAVTPGISLEAGKTYKFEMYGLLRGWEGVKEEFKVAVGTSNTVAAMTTVIIDKTGANAQANTDWVKYTGKFTPTTTGTYYFGINVCSPKGGDLVSFDNILIADENYIMVPEGKIHTKGGLWSEDPTNGVVFLSDGQKLTHSFTSNSYSSFSWNFGNGATPSTSTETSPSVTYAEGIQDISLSLTGEGGTSDIGYSFEVLRPFGYSESVGNIKPEDKLAIYRVEENGYLLGANSIYKIIAEKYELPSYEEVEISALTYYVGVAKAETANLDANCPIYIVSEGENGFPENGIATLGATYKNLFGETPVTDGSAFIIDFEPIKVNGSFFIAFDFTEFTNDANNQIAFFSTEARKYADCTSYIYYNSEWYPASGVFRDTEISAFFFPTLTWTIDTNGVEEGVDNSAVKVSTSRNLITIKDSEGLATSVTTLDGKVVYSNLSTDSNVEISASSGIYVVKVGSSVIKVIVK